ncbi:hypothetical protein B0T14DRAFT_284815 [Immersiella caudata]|uniref:Uncharacterized protein n=1 Tax=Immersiella caudata TaxID=314043 RepID=A0AA39WE86_9PEZI|nr:hypothetical protein B0T14DRAFT_284815 [Immersiella caudata]
MRGSSSQGLTLPMRYIMRKRLKTLEVTERRQVGDTESLVHPSSGDGGGYSGGRQRDSEL